MGASTRDASVHGHLLVGNLLVNNGRLAAVVEQALPMW